MDKPTFIYYDIHAYSDLPEFPPQKREINIITTDEELARSFGKILIDAGYVSVSFYKLETTERLVPSCTC